MTKQAANELLRRELGGSYRVWKRNGLFYLGNSITCGGRQVALNRFVSSAGYEDVVVRAGVSFHNPAMMTVHLERSQNRTPATR